MAQVLRNPEPHPGFAPPARRGCWHTHPYRNIVARRAASRILIKDVLIPRGRAAIPAMTRAALSSSQQRFSIQFRKNEILYLFALWQGKFLALIEVGQDPGFILPNIGHRFITIKYVLKSRICFFA